MGEAKIFLIPCETNILRPVIRIEVTDSGINSALFPCTHKNKPQPEQVLGYAE